MGGLGPSLLFRCRTSGSNITQLKREKEGFSFLKKEKKLCVLWKTRWFVLSFSFFPCLDDGSLFSLLIST